MDNIEIAARALCNWWGREPDHYCTANEPQWKHFESQARAVIYALGEAGAIFSDATVAQKLAIPKAKTK